MPDNDSQLTEADALLVRTEIRDERELIESFRDESPKKARESAALDGRVPQRAMLVMAEVLPERMESLRRCLDEMLEPDIEYNAVLPFVKLRSVHFARVLIHEQAADVRGRRIPPKVLFATDFDGSLDDHLDELLREVRPGIVRLFSHCADFPPEPSDAQLRAYLVEHLVSDAATVYGGTSLRTVRQIRREAQLHDAIQNFLDRQSPEEWRGVPPAEIRRQIIEFVRSDARLGWAMTEPGPLPKNRTLGMGWVLLGILAAIVLLPIALVLLPFAVLAAIVLRVKEIRDPVLDPDVAERARSLARDEDYIAQNQMSSVIDIKPGPFRALVLRGVLAAVRFSASNFNREGSLAGIPSIHFARWVIVDEGRRLLFFSNYDGSWENYLGDFIDKASQGLTGVWSNCVGFPRTVFLLWAGSRDEQSFKRYTRHSMIHTQVWYSAYKNLSVQNINNNSAIRLGLHGEMGPDQAAAWLRRF